MESFASLLTTVGLPLCFADALVQFWVPWSHGLAYLWQGGVGDRQAAALCSSHRRTFGITFSGWLCRKSPGLFCLPHISVDIITKAFLAQGLDVTAEVLELGKTFTEIAPRVRVLPMGCSWAFHLAHVAHEELATRSLPGTPFMRDRQPLPDLTKATAILVYADNCDHMGPDQMVVDNH